MSPSTRGRDRAAREATLGVVRSIFRVLLMGRAQGMRARLWRRVNAWRAPATSDTAATEARAGAPTSAKGAKQGRDDKQPSPADEGMVRIASLDEAPLNTPVEFFVDQSPIAIVRREDGVYALAGVCPHADGPLGEGSLDGDDLVCPWHGWGFDVKTGKCRVMEDVQVEPWRAAIWDGGIWVGRG